MKITFVQTGGSIDKDYPKTSEHHSYNFEIGQPAFEKIVKNVSPHLSAEFHSVCRKDSLDLTDADREAIREYCASLANDKIVITHGTDTIIETAQQLTKIPGKIIVLTGAMKPELFHNSDANFNLGTAVGAVQSLPPGVYIALSGLVLPWNQCRWDENSLQLIKLSKS